MLDPQTRQQAVKRNERLCKLYFHPTNPATLKDCMGLFNLTNSEVFMILKDSYNA